MPVETYSWDAVSISSSNAILQYGASGAGGGPLPGFAGSVIPEHESGPGTARVYVTCMGKWEHKDDGSPCPDGLACRLNVWEVIPYPFCCKHDRLITKATSQHKASFWMDDIKITSSNTLVPTLYNWLTANGH